MTLRLPLPHTIQQPIRPLEWLPDDAEIDYPSEDGLPMAESDHQRIPLTYGVESLDLYFKQDPAIYVSGNLLIYPEKGNPYESVAPDLFVVFGVEDRLRDSYKLWEEKQVPAFVLEILSTSTASKDRGSKKGMYQFWGVKEYFLHDPKKSHIDPPLQAVRLRADGSYETVDAELLEDGTATIYSETLALEVHVFINGELRFYDPIARRYLPNYAEANQLAEQAQQQALEATQVARQAQQQALEANQVAQQTKQENARLRAKLRALGIDPDSI